MGTDARPIDWEEIKRRVNEAGRALEGSASSAEKAALLRRRAAELAAPIEAEPAAEGVMAAVVFRVGRERYAVGAAFVREARRVVKLTPVPCVPGFIAGVFNLRGEIVSVVDLRRLFGIPDAPIAESAMAVVLGDGVRSFALLADEVMGSTDVDRKALTAALAGVSGAGADYLAGVSADGLIALDAARLLKDDALVVNETV